MNQRPKSAIGDLHDSIFFLRDHRFEEAVRMPIALLLLLQTKAGNLSGDSLKGSPPSIEIARVTCEGEML